MPVLTVVTDRFTSNLNGWFTSSFLVAWNGTDGSDLAGASDPGCVAAQINAPGGLSFMQSNAFPIQTWETVGIPVGATVTNVRARLRWKFIGSSGTPDTSNISVELYLGSGAFQIVPLDHPNAVLDPAGTWITLTGTTVAVPALFQASGTQVIREIAATSSGAGYSSWNGRWDTLELDITYTGGGGPSVVDFPATSLGGSSGGSRAKIVSSHELGYFQPPNPHIAPATKLSVCDVTVTPVSAVVPPGGTQQFTANGVWSVPVTWAVSTLSGSGTATIDSTGLFTAPDTPGTFAVTAVSQADSTCGAGARVNVLSVLAGTMHADTELILQPFGLVPVPRPAHIDTAKPTSVFWYHENRLYASFAGKTYCRDMLNPQGSFTDCGYGFVISRFVISRFNFPNVAFLVANMEPIAYGERATVVSLTHRNMDASQPNTDVVPHKQVHFRPFDGSGKDREARKIADRLRVWGSVSRRGGNHKTGTLTWRGERGIDQSAEIYEGLQEPDEIAQQEFPPSFYAWLLECDLDLDDSVVDATILEAMLEYRPQD